MANYYKVAAKAVAELFDGTQEGAEALVTAYPESISIQSDITYPELEGQVLVDVGNTGITVDVDVSKEDIYSPYEIVFTVTGTATATDDITITFWEEDPIVVAVTNEDDNLTIAAAIAGATFPGFTAVDGLDGTVTVTQDAIANAILAVVKEDGSIQNAYKDDYIAFITEMEKAPFEIYKTQIWAKTWFEKYFIAEGA